jgi:hypothetical protein
MADPISTRILEHKIVENVLTSESEMLITISAKRGFGFPNLHPHLNRQPESVSILFYTFRCTFAVFRATMAFLLILSIGILF